MSESSVITHATSVHAVVVPRTGGSEVLEYREIEVPAPSAGELTVDIRAAGVNFIDTYQRDGVYPVPLPYVLGFEGAGVVTAVCGDPDAEPVHRAPAEGDRVGWAWVPGSYAERAVGPIGGYYTIPDEVSFEQAAAVGLQGITAHYLATDCYRIQPGDTVLVHAGAGGVGLLLTQIAVLKGGRVLTTVSTPEKAELSRGAGASDVLVGYGAGDADGTDFADWARDLTDGEGVAAVYDGVGKDTFESSLKSLRIRGTMVLFGGASGQVPPFDPQRLNALGSLFLTRPTMAHFIRTRQELLSRTDDLFGWIADGRLDVRIGATFPLREAGAAQDALTGRKSTGKVLLLP